VNGRVDLEVIYKKVKQRANPRRCSDARQRIAAGEAADAARQIARDSRRTLKDVDRFRRLEETWRVYAKGNAICYADVLEEAIKSGNYTSEFRHFGYRTGVKDEPGHVYVMVSREWPGKVKIGTRLVSSKKREGLLKSQTGLRGVIEFEISVQSRFEVEHRAQRILRERGLGVWGPGKNGKNSAEWFKVDARTAAKAVRQAWNEVEERVATATQSRAKSTKVSGGVTRRAADQATNEPALKQSMSAAQRRKLAAKWPFKSGERP
jgi:hypothetical protein